MKNQVTILHLAFAESVSTAGKTVLNIGSETPLTTHELAEKAFEYTNCPAPDEYQPDTDLASQTGRCYSLSVGDFVKVGEAYLICRPIGFEVIEGKEITKFLKSLDGKLGQDLFLAVSDFARKSVVSKDV